MAKKEGGPFTGSMHADGPASEMTLHHFSQALSEYFSDFTVQKNHLGKLVKSVKTPGPHLQGS